MGSTKRTALLLLPMLLLCACATSGNKGREVEASQPVTQSGITVAQVKKEKPPVPSMSEAQREALQTVLELMRAGEWLTARELMQELLLAHPALAVAYANMGNIHLQLGDSEKAEQAWLKALELRPGWAAVYNQLGIFYRDQARFNQALTMYQKALVADEAYANSHRNIAILYELYLGEGQKALQHYRRYRELIGGEEREVLMWIADLDRRIQRAGE